MYNYNIIVFKFTMDNIFIFPLISFLSLFTFLKNNNIAIIISSKYYFWIYLGFLSLEISKFKKNENSVRFDAFLNLYILSSLIVIPFLLLIDIYILCTTKILQNDYTKYIKYLDDKLPKKSQKKHLKQVIKQEVQDE